MKTVLDKIHNVIRSKNPKTVVKIEISIRDQEKLEFLEVQNFIGNDDEEIDFSKPRAKIKNIWNPAPEVYVTITCPPGYIRICFDDNDKTSLSWKDLMK